MPKYGKAWQSSKKFADDFAKWLLDNADGTSTVFFAFAFAHLLNLHLETKDEILCAFCVEIVEHLSNARVVRVRLQPTVLCDGHRFYVLSSKNSTRYRIFTCTGSANSKKCGAYLLVPNAAAELTESVAILNGEHKHQRVSRRLSNAHI